MSFGKRLEMGLWHPAHGPPKLVRAGLDKVGLLFGCFISNLPLCRIQGPAPRTAHHDGQRHVKMHGGKVAEHLKRTESGGRDRATLPAVTK